MAGEHLRGAKPGRDVQYMFYTHDFEARKQKRI